MKEIIDYYKTILNQNNYTIREETEGNHDCIVIDIPYHSFKYHNIEYYSSFIIFYKYSLENGVYISRKENKEIEDIYTFINEGYGEGLYIQKQQENPDLNDMYMKIIQLINADNKIKNI